MSCHRFSRIFIKLALLVPTTIIISLLRILCQMNIRIIATLLLSEPFCEQSILLPGSRGKSLPHNGSDNSDADYDDNNYVADDDADGRIRPRQTDPTVHHGEYEDTLTEESVNRAVSRRSLGDLEESMMPESQAPLYHHSSKTDKAKNLVSRAK